jgi:D-arginine utilization repressor
MRRGLARLARHQISLASAHEDDGWRLGSGEELIGRGWLPLPMLVQPERHASPVRGAPDLGFDISSSSDVSSTSTVGLSWAASFESVCAAIAQLLDPHAEVVLHDLASDRIIGIWNPLSGRRVGDVSLIDELPEGWAGAPVQGPYRKVLADGRYLSAVSAVVCDPDGVACGLLCVNLDRSPFEQALDVLSRFAAPRAPRPRELFVRDWREQIALTVDDECRSRGMSRERLTREDRLSLVRALDERGLFATRHAAEYAAHALGVSRATVYALLKEVRADARAA